MRFPRRPEPGRWGHQTAHPSLLNLRACLDLRGLMPKGETMWDFKQAQSEQVLDTSHAACLQIFGYDAKWKKKKKKEFEVSWEFLSLPSLTSSCSSLSAVRLSVSRCCLPSVTSGIYHPCVTQPSCALLSSRPCRAAPTSPLAARLLGAPAPFISSVFLICVFHVIFPFH